MPVHQTPAQGGPDEAPVEPWQLARVNLAASPPTSVVARELPPSRNLIELPSPGSAALVGLAVLVALRRRRR